MKVIFRFFQLGLLFLKYERNSRLIWSLHMISLYALEAFEISQENIITGWLAAFYISRIVLLFMAAGLSRSCIPWRRASSHMHSEAAEYRKVILKGSLRRSSTAAGVIRNEIAPNRRDKYLVSRFRGGRSADWLTAQILLSNSRTCRNVQRIFTKYYTQFIDVHARKLISHVHLLSEIDLLFHRAHYF